MKKVQSEEWKRREGAWFDLYSDQWMNGWLQEVLYRNIADPWATYWTPQKES